MPKRKAPPADRELTDAAAPPVDDGTQQRVLHELIGERAFLISQGPDAGSTEENWYRAEQELAHEDARRLAVEIERRALEVAHRVSLTHP